eukprot:2398059-Amphidinium_carterae.1
MWRALAFNNVIGPILPALATYLQRAKAIACLNTKAQADGASEHNSWNTTAGADMVWAISDTLR